MTERLTHDHNHLLAALPDDVKKRLSPHIDTVPLSLGQIIHTSGSALNHVYFPIDAIVSLLYPGLFMRPT